MIEPNGCRWCGIPERVHAQRWTPSVGWHKHEQPVDAQRLARMRDRRDTRAPSADDANVLGRAVAKLTMNYERRVAKLEARVAELETCVAEREDDARRLAALENAGVDNWDGYDYAMELLREYESRDGL